ncbi:MAG TPA: VOC family protein, partial [Polyangiaceae bacterium]|nr:VOC family protein [Polyangiaceae bacterium]
SFMSEMLGLPPPEAFYHFLVVRTANGVSLDFLETDQDIEIAHYAFLVSEDDFDRIFARLQERGVPYYADPSLSRANQINRNDGGRGVYFADPAGHVLEAITVPYGGKR